MSQEPGMATSDGAAPEIEPLEQELLRLLQSEAVRGYLRQAAGTILSPVRPSAPPELSAAGAIAEQLQQMIRHMSSEALQALTGEHAAPAAAGDDRCAS
jgi:hypothetical protein